MSSVSNIYIYIYIYVYFFESYMACKKHSLWLASRPWGPGLTYCYWGSELGAMDSLVIKVQVNGNLFIINQSALMNYYP